MRFILIFKAGIYDSKKGRKMTRYVKEAPFVNKGYLVFRQTKMMLKRVTGVRLQGKTSP